MTWRRLAALAILGLGLASQPVSAEDPPPIAGPDMPAPLKPGDAFGEPVELPERTIIYIEGSAPWDAAFDTLIKAYRSLNEYLDKQGIKAAGPAMTIYTETDDAGFKFRAALPVADPPKTPPQGNIGVGPAPSGKALKFVHRGSYDAMDSTYEAITNYLDDRQIDAKDVFIEEYETDITSTPQDKLVVTVYVPVK